MLLLDADGLFFFLLHLHDPALGSDQLSVLVHLDFLQFVVLSGQLLGKLLQLSDLLFFFVEVFIYCLFVDQIVDVLLPLPQSLLIHFYLRLELFDLQLLLLDDALQIEHSFRRYLIGFVGLIVPHCFL